MEKNVRNKPPGWFTTLNTYYTGPVENFSIKIGDLISFKRIAMDVKAKGLEFFTVSRKPNKNIKEVNNWEAQYPCLKLMLDHAKKSSRVYDKKLKDLGLFLFLRCGPSAYSFLVKKLPLPSLQTVKKELGLIENVVEGNVRVDDLVTFLKTNRLPPYVWLSEDATRCISKVSMRNSK